MVTIILNDYPMLKYVYVLSFSRRLPTCPPFFNSQLLFCGLPSLKEQRTRKVMYPSFPPFLPPSVFPLTDMCWWV